MRLLQCQTLRAMLVNMLMKPAQTLMSATLTKWIDVMTPELKKLLEQSKKNVDAMTPEQKEAMLKAQGESWARAEASWPKPKYKWVNGVKVYDSYEDYCND